MGKSQTKKKTQPSRRHNPIRVPDSHLGAGAGKADKSKQEAMIPVLAKLNSPDSGDRTWACAAVTNLIHNDPSTRRMLQSKNVVGELITRLSDDVDEVVMESAGALRNLAIDGGHELCNEMYNKSIIPALVILVGKVSTILERIVTSQPVEGDAEVNARKVVFQLSENVVSLFWCLSEASHKTLAAVNNVNLVPFLVGFLSARALLPISLTLAATQCLYSLSPDNEPLREGLLSAPTGVATVLDVLRADHTALSKASGERKKASKKSKSKSGDAMDVSEEISIDGRYLLVRVLAAGIIRNVALPGSKLEEEIDVNKLTREIILPLLDPLLNVDLHAISNEVASLAAQLPSSSEVAANLTKQLKTDHKTSVEKQLEATEVKLSTLIVGLEIMTSICAGLEDQEVAEEAQEAESDEDMDEEDDDEALIAQGREQGDVSAGGASSNGAALTANIAQTLGFLLQSFTLPARLSAMIIGTSLSYPPLPPTASLHPPTTALLSTIHLRALEAINNLYLTASASIGPSAPAGAAEQLDAQLVWERLFESAKAAVPSAEVLGVKGHEIRVEVMDMVVGGLWGIAKATGGDLNVVPAQVQILQDASAVVSSDVVRVRCIETLAVLAARPRVSNEENLTIGNWLMSTLSAPALPGAEILVAVLNAVFDIYGDEERAYDSVFVSQGYLNVLASIVAKVRAEARKVDRRKVPELRTRAEEAYENLAAFVKYRRNLRR